MSTDFAERPPAREDDTTNASAGCGSEDRLAALMIGLERPIAYYVDELLVSWRHAQEAVHAYARWHELAPRDGHAVYLAALDREERAAGVYAEVRRRAIDRSTST